MTDGTKSIVFFYIRNCDPAKTRRIGNYKTAKSYTIGKSGYVIVILINFQVNIMLIQAKNQGNMFDNL